MHLKHTDIFRCTPNGKSSRQPSLMVTIMLTDVLSLAIMHQVDSGASSSDLYVGLEFMSEALRDFQPNIQVRDRKSTRLNSSHTVISYAVFCLKKKKKRN